MGHTAIEWTDRVWNPVTGCTKVSQGCKNCYAERIANRRMPHGGFTDRPFTTVRCHPERLDQPLHWRKPQRVFVNSMSDLFHEDVPDEFIELVFAVMALTDRHKFQVLTKRPARMLALLSQRGDHPPAAFLDRVGRRCEHHAETVEKISPSAMMGFDAWWQGIEESRFIPNVHLCVSVEDQPTADERIPLLLQTPAAVRGVSYEPALGPVNFAPWIGEGVCSRDAEGRHCVHWWDGAGEPCCRCGQFAPLDWLIAGGESGPGARPTHPDWFRSVRDQCAAAGVAFFFKQWGEWAPHTDRDRDDPDWRADYTITDRNPERYRILNLAGGYGFHGQRVHMMERTGKRKSGRLLEGREHSDFPA